LKGKTVAVWGMTYKPGTDTLRRSSAVELCKWLLEQGAWVRAYDPAVKRLPEDLNRVQLAGSAQDAVQNADALVVATEWPEYRNVDMSAALSAMNTPYVLDVNRFLAKSVENLPAVKYVAVGKAVK